MTDAQNNADALTFIHDVAGRAVHDFKTASNRMGTGDVRTAVVLERAITEGLCDVDDVSIPQMLKSTDRKEMNAGLASIKHRVFEVLEQDDNGKLKVATDNSNNPVMDNNALKALTQSIKRMLPVAVHLYHNGGYETAYKLATRKQGNKQVETGEMLVRGLIFYPQQKLEDEPHLSDNWVKLQKTTGQSMNDLIKRAKSDLGISTGKGRDQQAAETRQQADPGSLASALNGALSGMSYSDFQKRFSKTAREEIMALAYTLDNLLDMDEVREHMNAEDKEAETA